MSENLHAEILSVAPLQSAERLAAIGRTIDAVPELAPQRMGQRDPPRTRIRSAEAQLEAWAPSIRPGDYYNQFMARENPHAYGLLWITGDIWRFPPIAPHKLELGVEEAWLGAPSGRDAARLERFASLFRDLCESMDAFWGGAGLTSFRRQTNDLVLRAQMAGTLVLPGVPGTGWDMREHTLPDVYWLNFFGPAFVEHWGAGAVERLGIRRDTAANGGVVVWTTETPFVFDPGAASLDAYPWKRQFANVLSPDAVLHDTWRDPGAGVAVPSYEAHRRFVARG